jgi:transposase
MNQFWVSPYLGEYLMTKFSIARRNVQDQPGTLHVGVDLALEKNVVVVINEKGQRLDRFCFPQDRGGYDYFLEHLEGLRQKQSASGLVVAMEPSNYFWKLLAQELEQKRNSYRLVNAYTVKKHREGNQLDRSKDDRRDADQIAELSRIGHYTQTRLQKGAYEELRQYAALHDQLIQAIVREKNVLWGLVGQVFPELFQVFKDLGKETAQALLSACVPAANIRKLSLEGFVALVRRNYSGKKLCVSKLRRVHQLAAISIGVTEGLPAVQLAIQVHLAELQTVQEQLKRVVSAMTACLAPMPESPYLLSMKSLNTVSAAIFFGRSR